MRGESPVSPVSRGFCQGRNMPRIGYPVPTKNALCERTIQVLVRKLEYSAPTQTGSRRHGRTVRCQLVGRTASIARLNRSQQCAATGPLKMLAQASRRFHYCQQHGVRTNPATDSRPTKTMFWTGGDSRGPGGPQTLTGCSRRAIL